MVVVFCSKNGRPMLQPPIGLSTVVFFSPDFTVLIGMFVSSEYAYFRKTHCVLCRNFYYSRGNTQYRKWRFTRMNFHDYLVGKQVQWSCKMVKCMFYCYRIEEMWL